MHPFFFKNLLQSLMLAFIYVISAKVGLLLSFEQAQVSPVWPPTGISLAALLFFGLRLWPGIFIGAILINIDLSIPMSLSFLSAIGSTLEAVIAAYLILHFASAQPFYKMRDTIIFILALLGATMISASIGVTSLFFANIVPQESILISWGTWWIGDLVGGLLVTPFLLTWFKAPREAFTQKQLIEASLMLLTTLSVVGIFFGPWNTFELPTELKLFSLLPIFTWSVLRFYHHGATLVVMVISMTAILGTINGYGPFVLANENESLLALQVYMGAAIFIMLILMSIQEERRDAFHALRLSKRNLETTVASRTFELKESNTHLAQEIEQQSHLADSLKMLLYNMGNSTKERFFHNSAKTLTRTYKTRFSLIGIFANQEKNAIKTVAVWANGALAENFTYQLKGTPCADILNHSMELIPEHATSLYPQDKMLTEMGIESYFGSPLTTSTGEIIGIISVMDTKPLIIEDILKSVLALFSSKIALELQRQMITAELELAASVFNESLEAIIICNTEATIIRVNPAFTEITGYSSDEAIGRKPTLLKSGEHSKAFYERLWKSIMTQGYWKGEITNKRKNGEIFITSQIIKAVKDESGIVQQYISMMSDITSNKKIEQQLQQLAHQDLITQLPNRASFLRLLNEALIKASQSNDRLAVMFIDLDNFKLINDTSGHPVGDELLQHVAKRLKSAIGKNKVVSRFGGDEFTILIPTIESIEESAQVATQILNSLLLPFALLSCEITISASIGIGIYPDDAQDASSLLSCADNAMYSAKESGRASFHFYTEQMKINAHQRVVLERELRQALKLGQFVLNYQPQVDIKTGKIVGTEALIRWIHPTKGLIPPNKFIPIAEITGLIVPIGQWVIEEACQQLNRWRAEGFVDLTMAINLSARQFFQKDLLDTIESAIQESAIPASKLEFEITESMMMDNIEGTIDTLHKVKGLGVQLSMDDFGTGFSSLSYLKRFPLNKLKIDKSFIDGLPGDNDDLAIVQAIIGIAHSLHLTVIAEGVETGEQYNFLKKHHCNEVQGYYFSKPLAAKEASLFLKNQQI